MEALTKTVFIGNLPWITNNDDLYQFMSQAGPLVFAEVQRYEDTHRSKGWGLAEFVSLEAAARAVSVLDRQELNGRQVHLHLDRNSLDANDGAIRVYIGNLPWTTAEQNLMELFGPFRPLSCSILTNMYGRSRGFAIMKFMTEEEALVAINAMNQYLFIDRPVECRFDRGPAKVEDTEARNSVYVGRLPPTLVDDAALVALFRHIGPIVTTKLVRPTSGRGGRGYGTIKFLNYADAKQAVESMNGVRIGANVQPLEVRFDRNK